MKKAILAALGCVIISSCVAESPSNTPIQNDQKILSNTPSLQIQPGAHQINEYLPLLKGKKVAIIGNQTSEINGVLLPDTLQALGVKLVKLFSPEHGFRGTADAGANVKSDIDPGTKLPIVSLYGSKKSLPISELKGVDVLIYDLQDVGARFYTYISTLEYALKAAAQAGVEVIILDRPNPLGHIVDGPVLKEAHKSFVGMQPIPVIYGMTPGEYAQMIVGEKWINVPNLKLEIIPVKNYTHKSLYHLPVPPSPNLKNMASIYLYPSLCFFEGTEISLGRGTPTPFQLFGHPSLAGKQGMDYTFTPRSMTGATNPPLLNKFCNGQFIANNYEEAKFKAEDRLNLSWLLAAYKAFPNKDKFFNNFFNTLAGNNQLKQQIIAGKTEPEIRDSWKKDIDNFKLIRKKYLLYSDFE